MANTLSLGSGNWGAKESLLLGYYEDGTQFLPETFDVTRATGGTRVNKDGLIETPAEIGSELVVNGNFATDSDWTLGSGWNISGGSLIASSASSNSFQTSSFVLGKIYKATYSISDYVSGTFRIQVGSGGIGNTNSSNGTFVEYIEYSGSNFLYLKGSSSFNGSIDNVSVKEYNNKNLARIDYLDDAKGALLTEPQSTNLVTYSEDFSDSSWEKTNSTIVANSTISPDGTLNADKVVETSAISYTRVRQSFSFISGNSYSFSVFYKANGRNFIQLEFNTSAFPTSSLGVFDVGTGTVNNVGTGLDSASIKDFGNGWYRCTATATSDVTTNALVAMYVSETASVSYQGNGVSGGFIWGAQLEGENALGYNGEYATSYIPTDGSTVTRNQDEVNNGGDVNSFGSEGVLYFEAAYLTDSGLYRKISINDGTNDNQITIESRPALNQVKAFVTVGGVSSFSSVHTLTDITGFNKMALKWKENDFSFFANGVNVQSNSSGVTPASGTLTELSFGIGSGSRFFGKTKNIQAFNTALSDSDLLSLTTTGSVPYWTQYSAMATSLNYTNK